MAPKGKAAGKKGSGGGDDAGNSKLKVADSLLLRHILCEKQSRMLEAKAKLEAGTPFNQVATEYSEDKARSGGNLGWMNRAGMMGAFQDVCFTIPVSSCAKPDWREIKTKHGYHLVIVEGRK